MPLKIGIHQQIYIVHISQHNFDIIIKFVLFFFTYNIENI
jgi:hypothetical protein